ncbi:MAG: 50S ribosomal protein L4 [Burkholderiaceae bacterium]
MQLKLVSPTGATSASVEASDAIFGRDFNESLIHQLVVAYQANARSGTRKQKNRADVHHSTKKPYRQKGTGRARAGMTSSPIWRGGGRAFPSSPNENFKQKLNRKMYRAGVCSILSQLAREDRLLIADDLNVDSPKTKQFLGKLKAMGLDHSVLVITDELSENMHLASRNLPTVLCVEAKDADPVALVRFDKVVMTKPALEKFQEMLA